MDNYFELKISINPNMEEVISDIFFTHFDCEGVVLEEQSYKDLEMTSTTRGTLRVFLNLKENMQDKNNPPLEGGSKSLISGRGIYANHKYTQTAKENAIKLRNNPTKQERIVWKHLNKSQLGYKFRRQQPFGKYIVDFFCPELGLIIELDGGQHNISNNIEYDNIRSQFIENNGYKIIRIWNNDVDNNIAGVIEYIKNCIQDLKPPPPNPLPQEAGESSIHFFLSNIKEVLNTERELLKSRGFSDEELGSWEITLDEKENQDWSKKWKEKWTVTHVTENIAVVPSWLEYNPKPNEVTISLDPGCAFGTGTHQTTQLCMKALEKYLNEGDTVADIGTGSGILSILAMKLGAKSAYGCDIDETVIDVCKENAKINNVKATFELNSADKLTEKYDFVCANILHNVLAEIMEDLKNLLKPDAKLSLSGILDEKKEVVLKAIKDNGLKIIDTITQDQWISYVVTL